MSWSLPRNPDDYYYMITDFQRYLLWGNTEAAEKAYKESKENNLEKNFTFDFTCELINISTNQVHVLEWLYQK